MGYCDLPPLTQQIVKSFSSRRLFRLHFRHRHSSHDSSTTTCGQERNEPFKSGYAKVWRKSDIQWLLFPFFQVSISSGAVSNFTSMVHFCQVVMNFFSKLGHRAKRFLHRTHVILVLSASCPLDCRFRSIFNERYRYDLKCRYDNRSKSLYKIVGLQTWTIQSIWYSVRFRIVTKMFRNYISIYEIACIIKLLLIDYSSTP